MNPSRNVSAAITKVEFSFLSDDEIKRTSVKRIVNSTTFDSLLHPTTGGLYDLHLGAYADNL